MRPASSSGRTAGPGEPISEPALVVRGSRASATHRSTIARAEKHPEQFAVVALHGNRRHGVRPEPAGCGDHRLGVMDRGKGGPIRSPTVVVETGRCRTTRWRQFVDAAFSECISGI